MLVASIVMSGSRFPLTAQEQESSAVESVMRLLRSGRVPESRLEPILEIVCNRGNEHDLAYVYGQVLDADAYPPELRVKLLNSLADAARTRKVVPAGDLTGIADLLTSDEVDLQKAAVVLVGLWKVKGAEPELRQLVIESTPGALREKALASLVSLGPDAVRPVIDVLTAPDQPFADRAQGTAVLAQIDVQRAAKLAAELLRSAGPNDDLEPLLAAFLNRQGGSAVLAAAIKADPPEIDTAKLALRYIYSVGRSDAELSGVLAKLAGIDANPQPPTPEELAKLIEEVNASADPAAGEAVFRRTDLSCMKCHSVSKAGGQIGPDLSALGSSSPVDYIINSVFDPDAQIKEAFHTRVVLTADGEVLQGIVMDDTEQELVLKDAQGVIHRIPQSDIDDSREGKSLMPKGLVRFMTHEELINLVKFLSSLGKPGEYAVRETPRMQRWRVLSVVPEHLQTEVPDVVTFESELLNGGVWSPAYSRVNGYLPLDELTRTVKSPVIYLQGEVDVTEAGRVGVTMTAPPDTHVWVDDESFDTTPQFTTQLGEGRHKITLRVECGGESAGAVKLELQRLPDSAAEFTVVDGA